MRSGPPVAICAMVGSLLTFGGCGGSNSPTNVPAVTTPPAPVSTVLAEGSRSNLGVNALLGLDPFTTDAIGTLDVTVDWTFVTNNVQIYLAYAPCSVEQFNAVDCSIAGMSVSPTAKPERLHLTNLRAGTYSLLIDNRGLTVESVAFQIVFTR
jgi:hypothetical protein